MLSKVINVWKWREENKHSFEPPVCNCLAFHDQLKIMFVSGPNKRKDFHLQPSEEFFLQLKGKMVLKVIEKGKPKDIPIQENEFFLLPSNIPHSPQRFEDTFGLVIERKRHTNESDGLIWFAEGEDKTKKLYERYFHCTDLGTQLRPVISEFLQSTACQTNTPTPDSLISEPPTTINSDIDVLEAQNLQTLFKSNSNENQVVVSEKILTSTVPCEFQPTFLRGPFVKHHHSDSEVFVLQLEGESHLDHGDQILTLRKHDMILLPPPSQVTLSVSKGSMTLFLYL